MTVAEAIAILKDFPQEGTLVIAAGIDEYNNLSPSDFELDDDDNACVIDVGI